MKLFLLILVLCANNLAQSQIYDFALIEKYQVSTENYPKQIQKVIKTLQHRSFERTLAQLRDEQLISSFIYSQYIGFTLSDSTKGYLIDNGPLTKYEMAFDRMDLNHKNAHIHACLDSMGLLQQNSKFFAYPTYSLAFNGFTQEGPKPGQWLIETNLADEYNISLFYKIIGHFVELEEIMDSSKLTLKLTAMEIDSIPIEVKTNQKLVSFFDQTLYKICENPKYDLNPYDYINVSGSGAVYSILVDANYFILCHEFAHAVLGHKMDPNIAQIEKSKIKKEWEFQADSLGLEIFLGTAGSHSSEVASIAMAMNYLRCKEFYYEKNNLTLPNSHPGIDDRDRRLKKLISSKEINLSHYYFIETIFDALLEQSSYNNSGSD